MKHIPFEIVRAQAQDAVALLDYLKIVGGETENLSFGAEGVPLGVEDEQDYLGMQAQSRDHIQLLAKVDGEIIESVVGMRCGVRIDRAHSCFCKENRGGTD